MPIEMVGGEIEPAAHVGTELTRELELERGHLGHQHRGLTGGELTGRLEQWVAHVAGGDRILGRNTPAWRPPARSPSSCRWCR